MYVFEKKIFTWTEDSGQMYSESCDNHRQRNRESKHLFLPFLPNHGPHPL